MKTPKNVCLISADKNRDVEIKFKGGTTLILPPSVKKFNEYESHIVTQDGIVKAVPTRLNQDKILDVSIGDHVYGHHFMCIDEKVVNIEGEKLYANDYDSLYCKVDDNGEVVMLGQWNFVVPVFECLDDIQTPTGILLTYKHKAQSNLGKVIHLSHDLIELGVQENDVVIFKKNCEYEILISDKMFYRIRTKDIVGIVNGLRYEEEQLKLNFDEKTIYNRPQN